MYNFFLRAILFIIKFVQPYIVELIINKIIEIVFQKIVESFNAFVDYLNE